jgi:uncharacterized membrane protein YoaK (UPF0700 family)
LAAILAFGAGLVDVSGYIALRQFTSHMTGITATLAAGLGTNTMTLLAKSGLVLSSFLCGAAVCSIMVNLSRRRERESQFALPMLLEALLLYGVGLSVHRPISGMVILGILAFAMGLQNAIITKISDAEIRTTHVTGMVTDIGIELGRALYWNRNRRTEPVRARRQTLGTLIVLVLAFFLGGVAAAMVFPRYGFADLLPLAILLSALTFLPIYADLRNVANS